MKAGVVAGVVGTLTFAHLVILSAATPAFALTVVGVDPPTVVAGSTGVSVSVVVDPAAVTGFEKAWVGGVPQNLGPCPGSSVSAVSLIMPDALLAEPGQIELALKDCDGGTATAMLAVTGLGKAITAAIWFGLGAVGAWAFIMGIGQRW